MCERMRGSVVVFRNQKMPAKKKKKFGKHCRGRIFVKYDAGDLCETPSTKPKFDQNRAKISDTTLVDLSRFYCNRRKKNAIKALSSSEMISRCYDDEASIIITRMHPNTTLYVIVYFVQHYLNKVRASNDNVP